MNKFGTVAHIGEGKHITRGQPRLRPKGGQRLHNFWDPYVRQNDLTSSDEFGMVTPGAARSVITVTLLS